MQTLKFKARLQALHSNADAVRPQVKPPPPIDRDREETQSSWGNGAGLAVVSCL
jgi:hypothetical protein